MFVNSFMHMLEFTQIVVVDMEGKTWRKILRPPGPAMSIRGDQGQLCLCVGAKSDQQVNICSFIVRCDRIWPSTQ